ncbi:hypothetical protein [Nonomuraea sp. NPDC001023]|uniref:hypothetical protein n=1 Tax=unclassified Nonomuraea TaxID=2593643 RepID=UPI00331ED482
MIADANPTDSERVLIDHVLTMIKERLDRATEISAAQLRDDKFTRARFADMANQLDLAYVTIQKLNDKLNALAADPPPVEVAHVLSSTGGPQPVRLDLGGKAHTFLVPALGMEDPIDQARWWRRIKEQYGGA